MCLPKFQAIPDIQIGGYSNRDIYARNEQYKRCSRASDSSSAYSSMFQFPLDDSENADCDLPSNLQESLVDSDDEEGIGESTEVGSDSVTIIMSISPNTVHKIMLFGCSCNQGWHQFCFCNNQFKPLPCTVLPI